MSSFFSLVWGGGEAAQDFVQYFLILHSNGARERIRGPFLRVGKINFAKSWYTKKLVPVSPFSFFSVHLTLEGVTV